MGELIHGDFGKIREEAVDEGIKGLNLFFDPEATQAVIAMKKLSGLEANGEVVRYGLRFFQ